MPRDPTGSRSGLATDFGDWISGVAEWLFVVLFGKLGPIIVAAVAVYVTVVAFGDSSGDGIRAIVFFLLPTLWGAFLLARRSRSTTALAETGKWAVPVLGVIIGIGISIGMLSDAPVWSANLGLGVLEGFYFMMWLSTDEDEGERAWALALLLMVTIIAMTFALTQ